MKALMFMILLILAALGVLWWMSSQPTESNTPAQGAGARIQPGQQAVRRQAPVQSGQTTAASGTKQKTQDKSAVWYFTDYATGAMPLRIQQHTHRKLNKMQDKQNKQLEDAMK